MIAAYILIQTEVGVIGSVAAKVGGVKGVTSAEAVTGPYDVIARAEARNLDELGSSWSDGFRTSRASPARLPVP